LATENAYAELGLAPGASEAEVKVAWRRLASHWHPDRNQSAAASERMQRINEALEQIRRAGFASRVVGGSTDTPDDEQARSAPDAPDEARKKAADTASDSAAGSETRTLSRKVKLTLEEAAVGCVKSLRGKLADRCTACVSRGWRALDHACKDCRGSGERQRGWYGWLGTRVECEPCGGSGVARATCTSCKGSGRLPAHEYRVNARIPHGVRHGDLLHVAARGQRNGQTAVQLDLRVDLMPHPLFDLDADGTVRCEVPVDGFAWIANRAIEVPTLSGMQPLQLRREQITYRLSGQGFPRERRGPRGDHVVVLQPSFAQELSTEQNILLDQLVASTSAPGAKPASPRLSEWRQSLRDWERLRSRRSA